MRACVGGLEMSRIVKELLDENIQSGLKRKGTTTRLFPSCDSLVDENVYRCQDVFV